ncbi:MAG: PIG-L deacetylase family protein [Armatimonadota bacterium]|jgi:LmbE family N-acetylglucosaminyl deacetylase
MSTAPLRILVFGAHPDDSDLRCGGMAMKWRALGHRVKFISMTNGDTGHHEMGGGPLARRRYAETQAAAKVADIEYEVFDVHNGSLEPNLFYRGMTIVAIREYRPDLVICHRSCDYHPAHRAVGVLVQDAIFGCTVPNVMALTPALDHPPVLGYTYDAFTDPTPYVPTVAVDTDDVFERKVAMVHCHESQVYEWLVRFSEPIEDEEARLNDLTERLTRRFGNLADDARESLVRWYGEERGAAVRTAETVMISEYGAKPDEERLRELFPFLP